MLQAIIFDMDGIIIDSERLIDRELEEFCARRGVAYDREYIKPLCTGKGIHESTRIVLDALHSHESLDAAIVERRELRADLYSTQLEYIPGFLTFLESVQRRGLRTIVATGSSKYFLELIEERLHIQKLFAGNIVTIDQVAHSKPAPDIFLEAARRIEIDPAHCLVIEDAPYGVAAAHAAHMPVVAMTTTFSRHVLEDVHPTYIVDSYVEVEAIIVTSLLQ